MRANEIAAPGGESRRYLERFAGSFRTRNWREHLLAYAEGQLGPLERRSIEPIADAAGIPLRSLNQFLTQVLWREELVRDEVQRVVAAEHRGRRTS